MGHLSLEEVTLCEHRSISEESSPKCTKLWQKPGHEQSTYCTCSWCQIIITEKGCDTGKALVPHLQLQLTWVTRKHLALVAEPSQQLPSQGTGMRTNTCPQVCCSLQQCVTTAGTGGTAYSALPSSTLLLGFSPSSCHQTCPAPLETNTHRGNSHCPPLSNLWFPVMD